MRLLTWKRLADARLKSNDNLKRKSNDGLKRKSNDDSELESDDNFCLIEFTGSDIPLYAVLSHTWGPDEEEVTFRDLENGMAKDRAGYRKIRFCGQQAARDGLQYFWVDTCCIDKSSSAELSEAINSMYQWYHDAAKCYVYLSDVSTSDIPDESTFRKSRWFTRGWTLQELIAPESVEFFSLEGERLGDRKSLEQQIHEITRIPIEALQRSPLDYFSVDERLSWAAQRVTKREEDAAYSLLGIFDIHMPLLYGEGRKKAFNRLHEQIDKPSYGNLPSWAPGHTLSPGLLKQLAYELRLGINDDQGPDIKNHLKVQLLVRAYQSSGHCKAKIDPLQIRDQIEAFGYPRIKDLELSQYNFTKEDLSQEFALGPGILPRFRSDTREKMTLRDIVNACEKIYCGSYGVEYIHISDRDQCDWLRERLEVPTPYKFSIDDKRRILDRLIWGTSFESFLEHKYPNEKRFGLEGGESLIPGIKALIDRSVDYGVRDIVMGMPHRGRLNLLSNVIRKPNESIFSELSGTADPGDEGLGDVSYHLGMNFERPSPSGKRVQLSLVANPSHLEAEDPVVLGKTRAILHYNHDETDARTAMAVLLHGDAAFAGQGIVYETMGFHTLPSYHTGGTIHIIVNNQIGFTTDPRFSRSTPYCSDLAKAIDAPVFHVNGDDIEAVNFICRLAADWRAKFHKDVFIDLVCYRKQGHNETDQPSFTQPLMYKRISEQRPALDKYIEQLLDERAFTKEDIEEHKQWIWSMLELSFQQTEAYTPSDKEWLTSTWIGFKSPKELATEVLPHLPTGVDEKMLKHIGDTIGGTPDSFHLHRNLKRILADRSKTVEEGQNIDMATAEALAFGSLCLEGHHVRVSGQDVERGTFSQRHAVLHDQENEQTYTPLQHLSKDQGTFVIANSSLSEYGVLGFEYGYSLSSPNALVIWEAQFGDFANNAQCIIDEFIASGEVRWIQRSGIVMSLPHGYDGQDPENSSARVERYLQLCNEDSRVFPAPDKLDRQHQDCNMQVAYLTKPSNLFHILRRQMNRQFRKPLILFFSKSLLRDPQVRSSLREFTEDSYFQWIVSDPGHESGEIESHENIKRVVLCTGQLYIALTRHRAEIDDRTTAITRIEQLHPFPWAQLKKNLDSYPNAENIIWAQEEPLNAGGWSFTQPRIETLLNQTEYHNGKRLMYAGRNPSARVATGFESVRKKEEKAFLEKAFHGQWHIKGLRDGLIRSQGG